MHDDDGAVELVGIRRELLFHVIEVRHGSHIVILCGIRVQTEKLHTASDKREIESTVHHLIRLIASSQEVVVTDQGHEGIVQTVEDVARPLELVIGGSIRQVTTVNHEVDITTLVQVCHLVFGISEPQVGIADKGHAEGLLDVLLTMYVHIVRVYVEYTATR